MMSWPRPLDIRDMKIISLFVVLGLAFPMALRAAASADTAQLLDRARAVLLVEEEHGSTIVAKSPALELPIASLTKLMTALVFLESHPSWKREVTINAADLQGLGTRVLAVEDRLKLDQLFSLMLIHSDNNAALAIARESGLSLDEFVAAMNAKAEVLGLLHTHFVEPTGLDAGNRSTASDLVRLAWVAFQRPEIATALERRAFSLLLVRKDGKGAKMITKSIVSTNLLLGRKVGDLQVLLGKTGTTDEAGYSYIVRAGTLAKQPIHFLGVILSTATQHDRFDVALDILRFGAAQFAHAMIPHSPAPGFEVHSAAD